MLSDDELSSPALKMSCAMRAVNVNIGILGHVDSGKTSLARALSTTSSTAAFDKNPQSTERGITLDLGFSTFSLSVDDEMRGHGFGATEEVQVTLVDCPGHASLFKTVIGGSQILDLVLLVVDVTKGLQTQTAECLLLAEITCPARLLVVLNKTDLLPPADAAASLDKLRRRLAKTLAATSFKDAEMVPVAACPAADAPSVEPLRAALRRTLHLPRRSPDGPFLFAVDHCFPIRGQGTVLTGTVLKGEAAITDSVQIPSIGEIKKIKSIQVFRKSVNSVSAGERCGICVGGLDAKLFERGLVAEPDSLPTIHAAIVDIHPIPYFKVLFSYSSLHQSRVFNVISLPGKISSKSRFHISVGYETVMGRLFLFSDTEDSPCDALDLSREFVHVESVSTESGGIPAGRHIFGLLELETAVLAPLDSLFIASRLDTDILHHANSCRLAFHGRLLESFLTKNFRTTALPRLKVFKEKSRVGRVDRAADPDTVIVSGLLKKETNVDAFARLRVSLASGEGGLIEGGFGQSGKVRVRLDKGLLPGTQARLDAAAAKRKGKGKAPPTNEEPIQPIAVTLNFKRYLHDPAKKMIQ